MSKRNDDTSSLSHTKWNCQYHIVFCPKYRRKAIYGKLRADIGKYLRRLCEYKGYYVTTMGLNKKTVENYIRNQELEDQLKDKRSLKEYKDPFTGK